MHFVDIIIRKASLLERLFPEIHGGSSLVPAKEFNPQDLPARVRREQSLAEMTASQKVATAVALGELGYTVDSLGLEVSEQVQNLRLNRDVQGRGCLIADQQHRFDR